MFLLDFLAGFIPLGLLLWLLGLRLGTVTITPSVEPAGTPGCDWNGPLALWLGGGAFLVIVLIVLLVWLTMKVD